MVGYCGRILTKRFTSVNSKKCYMKVVKWLALNVISKPQLAQQVTYTIVKSYGSGVYVYTLEVFARLDGEQVKERHCAICKEVHSSFFINQESDCNNCKLCGYFNREHEMLHGKQQWVKEQIEKGGE